MNDLRLTDASFKKCNKVNYLGVLLDNKWYFKKYLKSATTKLMKFTGLFYKLRFIMSLKQKASVYKSFSQPVIQSGVFLYGTSNKTTKQIGRIIFRRQSPQSRANEREKYGIFLAKKLHIVEPLNFLTKTIRRDHKKEVYNRFIEVSELVNLDEKTKKQLRN